METEIWVVIALGVVGWGMFALHKWGHANFWRYLADTNDRHGTSFGTSPDAKETLIGADTYNGGVLAFDQKNRKIAYLTKGGKSIEILEYAFIRSWKVTWRETTKGGGAQFGIVAVGSTQTSQDKVFLEITTNDIKRPLIKMPMSTLRWAQESVARLEIMINAKF